MNAQQVILVNEADEPTGTMDKMEAHQKGLLHRAFSIFIFNGRGEMLLQQRADNKYHSPGLWTNACCRHPSPGEKTIDAAERRLQEELGFTVPLKNLFSFTYKHRFENGLTEFEFDHVFAGIYDGEISPDKAEVKAYCHKTTEDIASSIDTSPQEYTAWFKLAFAKVRNLISQQLGMVANLKE